MSGANTTAGSQKATKLAVVVFNLGGPDSPRAIRPFLLNLFKDPAILRVPFFIRFALARWIAHRRVGPATENYRILGGRSPLLDLTREQAAYVQAALEAQDPTQQVRCFVAMRYWHPFAAQTAREVRDWQPDHVVLLPLYPHYSTTTTGSSLTDWRQAAVRAGLVAPVTTLCCWHSDPGYIAATTRLVREAYDTARAQLAPHIPLRILFSAHGLPQVIVDRGDPYQHHVQASVAAVVKALDKPGVEHRICYQSRATPQKWLEPSAEAEIEQAGHDGVAVLVVPIAFVSEHSETLVELDIEYRDLALQHGVPGYFRVPAQNSASDFIAALADLVRKAKSRGVGLCSFTGGRNCIASDKDCPFGTG